jgi:ABC-type branched-subunit amino acid transport system ATPase component/ABC-type branched-subunit amino acid transport system permease subunit
VSVGAFVLGVLNGLIIGLLAVGLVLVYKSNRFLNLAQAQLGTLSALLVAKWVLDWQWNWWVAFSLAIAVGVLTGFLVERFLVGPLRARSSSPIRLLLLSLGVSQLLLALTYVPSFSPDTGSAAAARAAAQGGMYPQPFVSSLHIGGVRLTGMYVLAAVLVPILVAALAAFMRYSLLGKQIRAAANNPDAARLAGISVRRVSAVTWIIAGGLSAVSAVLAAPTQASFNVASLGPNLLMVTLGAAAFGAFVSLPLALAGGLLLGLVSQIVSATTSNASMAELAVFLVIMAIVFVRGRAIGRVFETSGAAVDDVPVTRIASSVRNSRLVRHHRAWLALGALAVGLVWPQLPYFSGAGNTFLLTLVLIFAVVGVGLTMLLGWGGQVSLGQFAVVGLGAYITAHLASHGWSLAALFLFTGAVGAAVMVLVGLPALRVRGLTLAVTTLGFAVISTDWLFHQSWVGSDKPFGMTVDPPRLGAGLGTPQSEHGVYYVALVVLALAIAAAAALQRSNPGRQFVAVRDNERASAAFGIAPATVKLSILAVSGFFAGAAGVLWADAWKSVTPLHFTADVSIAIIAIPVIGGLGSIAGAVAAAVALYAGTFFVGPHVSGLFGDFGHNLGFSLFLAGAGVTFTLLKLPTGLAGAAQATWQRYLDRRAARAGAAPVAEPSTADLVPELTDIKVRSVQVSVGGGGTAATADGDGGGTRRPVPARLQGYLDHRAERLLRADPVDGSSQPLEVSGVRVRFGGIVALDQPDITVGPGEIVGLIGANGAGKTTLMNVISGVIRPIEGSVSLFGAEVVDLPPDIRAAFGLSRSFQDASLFAGLTVVETLEVVIGERHKVGVASAMVGAPWVRASERRVRREAEEITDRFGLGAWADARTSELSTGTRRVCELAAQVAARPRVVLLDEPTAGVAQREAEAFGPLLRQIRDELDCAVLIVEHDMPLLMGLCSRMYALEAGRVIAEGAPDEIRHNPRVVSSYLGTEEAAITRSGKQKAGAAAGRRGSSRSTR